MNDLHSAMGECNDLYVPKLNLKKNVGLGIRYKSLHVFYECIEDVTVSVTTLLAY
jgi:hypothetical protein